MRKRSQSLKDHGDERSRKKSQCKGLKVETDFVLSRDRKTHVAGVERGGRNGIENEFEAVGGSHIISCFEEFGFYFKYNGKLVEGFEQEYEEIIWALLPRMDCWIVTEASAGSTAGLPAAWAWARMIVMKMGRSG